MKFIPKVLKNLKSLHVRGPELLKEIELSQLSLCTTNVKNFDFLLRKKFLSVKRYWFYFCCGSAALCSLWLVFFLSADELIKRFFDFDRPAPFHIFEINGRLQSLFIDGKLNVFFRVCRGSYRD